MLSLSLAMLFLLHDTEATILSRLLARSSSSGLQPQPVISIVSCNNSDTSPANYLINPPNANSYFLPTILNYALSHLSQNHNSATEDENGIDNGNRINSPISNQLSSSNTRPGGAIWLPTGIRLSGLPNRFTSSQSNFIQADQIEKTMDVENGLRFYLFTKDNVVLAEELKVNHKRSLNESKFSSSRPTKLILHGFTDVDASGEWVNVMKETYLSVADMNIIVADFSTFSLHNLIRTSLPVFAAKRLAEFIAFLESETTVPLDSFHVIARSYACHVAGMSGQLLNGRVGRITALEPSPKLAISGAPENKLAKENALFVDVVHVNGQRFFFHGPQFGLISPMGHSDVYPNIAEKGLGCPGENIMNSRRYSLRYCHLGRGVRYFTNSIKYAQLYPMCECSSFETYKAGLCSCYQREDMITFMGEHISNQSNGISRVFQLVPHQQSSSPSFSRFPNTVFRF